MKILIVEEEKKAQQICKQLEQLRCNEKQKDSIVTMSHQDFQLSFLQEEGVDAILLGIGEIPILKDKTEGMSDADKILRCMYSRNYHIPMLIIEEKGKKLHSNYVEIYDTIKQEYEEEKIRKILKDFLQNVKEGQ